MDLTDELRTLIVREAMITEATVLSSGKNSDMYFDIRRVALHHRGGPMVGRAMLDLTDDLDYDAVGGLTLGADPVALAMMYAAALEDRPLDAFVVRQEPKQHGLRNQIEGPSISGRSVLIVEDVCTTGASLVRAAACAEKAGATVMGTAAVIDRGGGRNVETFGYPFMAIYTLLKYADA